MNAGECLAAHQLLPLVYDELRRLAQSRLSREQPGQTIQATALVHEAYLRVVGKDDLAVWDGRDEFFAVAARAMRNILVEKARQKKRRAELLPRVDLTHDLAIAWEPGEDMDALNEALIQFAVRYPLDAQVFERRFFAGQHMTEIALGLQISEREAYLCWSFARTWLRRNLANSEDAGYAADEI